MVYRLSAADEQELECIISLLNDKGWARWPEQVGEDGERHSSEEAFLPSAPGHVLALYTILRLADPRVAGVACAQSNRHKLLRLGPQPSPLPALIVRSLDAACALLEPLLQGSARGEKHAHSADSTTSEACDSGAPAAKKLQLEHTESAASADEHELSLPDAVAHSTEQHPNASTAQLPPVTDARLSDVGATRLLTDLLCGGARAVHAVCAHDDETSRAWREALAAAGTERALEAVRNLPFSAAEPVRGWVDQALAALQGGV